MGTVDGGLGEEVTISLRNPISSYHLNCLSGQICTYLFGALPQYIFW
jgi:hypothetical protein